MKERRTLQQRFFTFVWIVNKSDNLLRGMKNHYNSYQDFIYGSLISCKALIWSHHAWHIQIESKQLDLKSK
jgi:hypothetical protein